jgi:hypothetical protein
VKVEISGCEAKVPFSKTYVYFKTFKSLKVSAQNSFSFCFAEKDERKRISQT